MRHIQMIYYLFFVDPHRCDKLINCIEECVDNNCQNFEDVIKMIISHFNMKSMLSINDINLHRTLKKYDAIINEVHQG